MKSKLAVWSIVAAVGLSGCESLGGPKQATGTVVGGAGGALIGSQVGKGSGRVAATAIGAVLGAMIGGDIGHSMDEMDRQRANQAFDRAVSSSVGTRINWNNPNNGHSGSVRTTRDGKADDGRYCREFVQDVNIGGKTQQAVGNACRNPDGTWTMQ